MGRAGRGGFAGELFSATDPEVCKRDRTSHQGPWVEWLPGFCEASTQMVPRPLRWRRACSSKVERWNILAALWEGLIKGCSMQVVCLLCRRQAVPFPAWMGLRRHGCGNWSASQNLQRHPCVVQPHYVSWGISTPRPSPPSQNTVSGGTQV